MPRSGGVGERRELGERAAAARAARSRRARRGARQRATSSSASSRRLYSTPSSPNEPIPFAATTRWHGTNGERRLRAQNVPGGAGGARTPRERGELAVGDDLTARDGSQSAGAFAEEPVVEVELDVGEVVRLAAEERLEPPRRARPRAPATRLRRACAGPRQLGPDDPLALEPELPHSEARARRTEGTSASPFDLVYRPAAMARRSVIHIYAPLLGYVYVSLGVVALAPRQRPSAGGRRALRRRGVRAALVPRQPARADHPLRAGWVLRERRRARRRLAARAAGRRARLEERARRRAGRRVRRRQ